MELCGIAQNDTGDGNGGRGRAERRYRAPHVEPAHQLFQHKNAARERGVERGGEARARAGGEQGAAVGPIAPEDLADEMPEGRRHLHARPFAAEGKSGADRQNPADELDRDNAVRRLRQFGVQNRFDMRDAAARRIGREFSHEPGRRARREGANQRERGQTGPSLEMRPCDRCVAKTVSPFEREQEQRGNDAGGQADQQRQNRKGGEPARIFLGIGRRPLFPAHPRPYPAFSVPAPRAGPGPSFPSADAFSYCEKWKSLLYNLRRFPQSGCGAGRERGSAAGKPGQKSLEMRPWGK